MTEEKLVVVKTFRRPFVAQMAVNRMEAEGIPTFLKDEHMTALRLDGGSGVLSGGVKLCVVESDEEVARALLDSLEEGDVDQEGEGGAEE